MTAQLRVRETIHHGDYYNVRDETIMPTWDGFAAMLNRSPYPAHQPSGNRYAAKLFADLLTSGAGDLGWARYEVIA